MTAKEIEQSIIKKYRKTIWKNFVKAIKEYQLIGENDHIAVCISGGKDSFLMAKCFEEIQKHGKYHFQISFICMDPGYQEKHLQLIQENASHLNIPLHIFKTDVFQVSEILNQEHPCYLCARMRRGYLYDYAKKLGCNKIALGHHFDDVIETILLSIFYSGETKVMMPKLTSTNFEGMQLIRPLYFIREKDILSWQENSQLTFLNCACTFTQKEEYKKKSKRQEIKELIKTLKKTNPFIEKNIFQAVNNVNLKTLISYQDEEGLHSFLDKFPQNKE